MAKVKRAVSHPGPMPKYGGLHDLTAGRRLVAYMQKLIAYYEARLAGPAPTPRRRK